ncbi:MAG: hypothetical protein SR1Q7_03810 [Quinella sp. 1Q7]|nr:hypothetical protein [Quinella sp. 1Q7]
MGCLLSVVIHKANLHDTKIGYWVTGLATFTYPTLKKICGDGGYRGSFVYEAYKYFGLRVEISIKAARLASVTKTLDSGADFFLA